MFALFSEHIAAGDAGCDVIAGAELTVTVAVLLVVLGAQAPLTMHR